MNTFVNRFSTTGSIAELRNAHALVGEGEISDVMWGSEAGFGSLAKGVPSFSIPDVADVGPLRKLEFFLC
jgi:20S proteasome subunit beta 5